RRLGLGRTAQAFSREFREGMANQARSRQLGDCGNSSPEKWLLGTRKGPRVHIVLLMYAKTAAHLSQLYEHLCPLQTREVFREVYVQDAFRPADDKEPFGFRDGMSQPLIEGSPIKPGPGQDVVRAGEFLLGYPDEYGYVPPSPTV